MENNGKSRLPIEKPGLHYEKTGLQLGLPIVKTRLTLGSKLGSVNVGLSDLEFVEEFVVRFSRFSLVLTEFFADHS